jgi:hypothetical protein
MLTRQQRRALQRRQQEEKPQESKVRYALRRVLQVPWWADFLGVVVAVFGIYQFYNASVPYVQPDAAISSSWRDLPLTAKITNPIFGAYNLNVFCNIENVTWPLARPYLMKAFRVIGKAEIKIEKVANYIPGGGTITFRCHIAETIIARSDANGEQLPIGLIKLYIRITYRSIFWPLSREITSPVFTWRAVSGGYQWLEGDASDSLN